MDGHPRVFLAFAIFFVTLCGSTGIVGLPPAHADEVTDWNIVAIDVLALGGQNPVVMTRGLAMAHLAVHDALNVIDRRYEPYLYDARSEPGGAPTAAVATTRTWASSRAHSRIWRASSARAPATNVMPLTTTQG